MLQHLKAEMMFQDTNEHERIAVGTLMCLTWSILVLSVGFCSVLRLGPVLFSLDLFSPILPCPDLQCLVLSGFLFFCFLLFCAIVFCSIAWCSVLFYIMLYPLLYLSF